MHDVAHEASEQSAEREISGRWVVVGMFAFAITMVGTLWLYWHFHTAPFRPLQVRLGTQFPYSRPQVQGGQRKTHKHTPRILRIVMKINFNPVENEMRATEFAREIAAITQEYQDLREYDQFEVHLHWAPPERRVVQWDISWPTSELIGQSAAPESR